MIYWVDEPVRGAGGQTLDGESERRIRVEGGMQIMKRVMVRYKVKADRAAEKLAIAKLGEPAKVAQDECQFHGDPPIQKLNIV